MSKPTTKTPAKPEFQPVPDRDQVFQQITLPPAHWQRVKTTLGGSILDATADELRAFMRPLKEAQVQTVTAEDGQEMLIITLPKGLWNMARATLGSLKWPVPAAEVTDFLDDLEAAPVVTVTKE